MGCQFFASQNTLDIASQNTFWFSRLGIETVFPSICVNETLRFLNTPKGNMHNYDKQMLKYRPAKKYLAKFSGNVYLNNVYDKNMF